MRKNETLVLDFVKEDFINSNYMNGNDCPLARLIKRMVSPNIIVNGYGKVAEMIKNKNGENTIEFEFMRVSKTVFNGQELKRKGNGSGYDSTIFDQIVANIDSFKSCKVTLKFI